MGEGPFIEASAALPAPQHVIMSRKVSSNFLPQPRRTPRSSKGLSLKEAILLALRSNPNIESSELQRVIDKFSLEVAHNFYVPQFSITGSANYVSKSRPSYQIGPSVSVKSPIGTTVRATYGNAFLGSPGEVTLTVKQALLRGAGWDYNTAQLANAVDTEKIAKLTFKNSVITVIVNVINSYRTLVQDYNNLAIQKTTLLRSRQRVKQTKLQVKAGKLAPSDLLQQQSNLATTRLSMLQQKSALQRDYQNFLEALGLVATAKLTIDKNINFNYPKIPRVRKCIQLALLNNIDYQSALIRLRSTKRALMQAKNEAKWQLDLTASTTVGAQTGTATVPAGTGTSGPSGTIASGGLGPSIGFTLDIPFNDIKAKQAILNARIALEQAKLSLREKKLQLVRTVTNQVNQIRDQYQQIKVAVAAVKMQEQTLKNTELKLRYGKTTVFEANQLQDQLLQQKTSLVADKIQLLNFVTTLNQTLGITLNKWGISLRY